MNKRKKELSDAADIIAKLQYGVDTGQIDEETAAEALVAQYILLKLVPPSPVEAKDFQFNWNEIDELDEMIEERLDLYKQKW